MRTELRARHVLGFERGDHVLHRDGAVVYEDDRILHVGRGWEGVADRVVDVGEALVLPGFIDLDAVADIDHAILDSWAGEELRKGHQWSEAYFRHGRRDVFSAPERAFIREYALAQLLLHGVTTCMPIASEVHSRWAETYDDMVAMAGAARRLGIRAYLGPSYRSGVNVVREGGAYDVLWDAGEGERGFEDAHRFLEFAPASGDDLVHGALLPCRIETLTIELMRATAGAARAAGALVRVHCMQGRLELDLVRRRHGATPVELLARTGLLGPNVLIPHAIHLPEERELEELARSGVTVVHCPLTSIRYGQALTSFDRYRAAGVNVALGSDSHPPDLIRGMDYGSNVAKLVEGRIDAGAAADYVRALTLGGARALGREDLGRLVPGAKADMVVVDLSDPRIGVVDDPIRTMLMHGSGRDVRMSVVAGRTVVRDGEIPGVDLPRMRRRAQELFARMRGAYSERDHRRRAAGELFPPSFAPHRP